MAKEFRVKETDQNHYCDHLADQADQGAGAGLCVIYDGTRPTNPEDANGNNVLVRIPLATPEAFGDAAGGSVSLNTPPGPGVAENGGIATHYRIYSSADGNAIVDPGNSKYQGTCGLADADMILSKVDISAGDEVTIQSMTIDVGRSLP